jgi:hypothetical protein
MAVTRSRRMRTFIGQSTRIVLAAFDLGDFRRIPKLPVSSTSAKSIAQTVPAAGQRRFAIVIRCARPFTRKEVPPCIERILWDRHGCGRDRDCGKNQNGQRDSESGAHLSYRPLLDFFFDVFPTFADFFFFAGSDSPWLSAFAAHDFNSAGFAMIVAGITT